MSSSGFSDPRLSRVDPSDLHTSRLQGAIQGGRPLLGAGMFGTHSASGVALSARGARRGKTARGGPFLVVRATPPAGHEGETGWVKVLATGTLLASAKPTSNVTITGLGGDGFKLALATNVRQIVWIAVDVTPLSDDPVGPPTGEIGHGHTWNGDDGAFYPSPVEYDTDDGTPDGIGDTLPDNRTQKKLYIPLARTFDIDHDPYPGLDLPGVMLTSAVRLVQLSTTHLRLYPDCYEGARVLLAMPWVGAVHTS